MPVGAVAVTAEPTPEPSTAQPAPEPESSESSSPEPVAPDSDSGAATPGSSTPEPPAPSENASDAPVDDEAEAPSADEPADGTPVPGAAPDGADAVPDPAPEQRTLARQLSIGILAAGIPEAPRTAWLETFEQGLNTTTATGLTAYASGRFSSTGWATGTNCTGVLVNYTATYPNTAFCPSQPILIGQSTLAAREVRRMADVLGQVAAGVAGATSANAPSNGSTAGATGTRSNHALTNDPYAAAGGTVVAQTTAGIGVVAPGSRYYMMQFDAVGAQCGINNASLSLGLFQGTTSLLNAFSAPVVPCTATGAVFYTSPALAASGGATDPAWGASVRAQRYTGTNVALLTAAQIAAAQVRVTNTVTGAGSAFGVDNLRVLDVSPALDMSFAPAPATATVPTTLTLTVTNTSELAAKTDWSFSAALPSGLVVAPAPAIGGTCAQSTGTAFAVTAAAGSASVAAVGGDLAVQATSCTITVNVVAANAGTYTVGPVTASGLVVSPPASITVDPATTLTVRKNLPARTASGDQFTLSVRSGTSVLASATTAGTATGIQPQQISNFVVQPGATYTIHETPTTGAGLGYASSYECTRDGTVIAVGSSPSGSLTMPADAGAAVVCTFTNTVQVPRLTCATNQFYAISGAGELMQSDIVTGVNTTIGTWNVGSNANALGIGPNGAYAYALQRSTDASNVVSMLKWSAAGGFQTIANSAYTTVGTGGTAVTGSIVAGAVDLSGNRFVFGKFSGSSFHLWSFTESNPVASRYAYLGSFPTAGAPNGNGDLAFDARGNLYVVGASTVNNVPSAAIFTVPAESIAAANGGVLPVTATTAKNLVGTDASPAFTNANGIAFSPRGTAYISDSATAYEFDPATWNRIGGSPRVLDEHTDLASCASPPTITVLKNAVGRIAASDQFTLTLANGATTVATATTGGTASGRQAAQIGPVPAVVGTTFTISEAMAAGSASAIGAYTSFSECWSDGLRLSNGTTTTGSVTMPTRPGANVVCTFFNSPRPATNVTVTKQINDPSTGTTAPAAGWTVGTSASATVGTATVLPSEAPRQQTNAQGTASWTVLYGSLASRATLVVSEETQTGYVFSSGSCTVGGAPVAVTFTQTGNIVSGSIPGTQSGQTIACTIVNSPVASLTLVKQVSFGSAAPTDWVLSATGPAGALTGPNGRSGTPQASAINVTPGVAYRLAEAGARPAYTRVGSWQCVTAAGTAVPVTAAGDVTLARGANVTCTVTNATAALTLVKQVEGSAPGFRPADWTLTAVPAPLDGATLPTQSRPGALFSAAGNPASTFEVRPGHAYTLDERATAPGSRLAYQLLRLERLEGSTWVTVTSRTISAPPPAQTAVYRFVNAPVQPTTLPLTGGMSSDAFTIAGGVLAALIFAAAIVHRRRRERFA